METKLTSATSKNADPFTNLELPPSGRGRDGFNSIDLQLDMALVNLRVALKRLVHLTGPELKLAKSNVESAGKIIAQLREWLLEMGVSQIGVHHEDDWRDLRVIPGPKYPHLRVIDGGKT